MTRLFLPLISILLLSFGCHEHFHSGKLTQTINSLHSDRSPADLQQRIEKYCTTRAYPCKIISSTGQTIIIQEDFDAEQTMRLANFTDEFSNLRLLKSTVYLTIILHPVAQGTYIEAKSMFIGQAEVIHYQFKAADLSNKVVYFQSNGIHETEFLRNITS
ncbi:MAG: hypothetical protein LWX56_06215 [Ignavibacteria bacterium]|nr:hypothetical protein [Ignavibacteria bacterium]